MRVNGNKVDIPSYQVKVGDVITVKERSRDIERLKDLREMAWDAPFQVVGAGRREPDR